MTGNRWKNLSVILALFLLTSLIHKNVTAQYSYESYAPIVIGGQETAVMPPVHFGFEVRHSLQTETLLQRAVALGGDWVRMNDRISWRMLQPEPDGLISWENLVDFEQELLLLKENGLTPIIVLDDYPDWATDHSVRKDGLPTSCGPILDEFLDDFASFVGQVVARYHVEPYNVHVWELGNEPDVDPDLVSPNSIFGCWGDIDAENYGGERYGEMVKRVAPVIKAVDPLAQVWLGGLLLSTPQTTDPQRGKPERFLIGVLESGAAPFFDVVPYHWYAIYYELDEEIDFDLESNHAWQSWGGGTVGKARYLRQLMQAYGVNKPLVLDEVSLLCPNQAPVVFPWCTPPDSRFYQAQADHLVRAFVRGIREQLTGFTWYTLEGPGWRHSGLLSGNSVKPVYLAYKHLISRLAGSVYIGDADYPEPLNGYVFDRLSDPPRQHLVVVWADVGTQASLLIPQAQWLAAYSRDGDIIAPIVDGEYFRVVITPHPIYLELAEDPPIQ